ncbi:MAG: serine hydrolase domain-containing protein [Trueperaceae bacterium]|nr:serine hydrolase domain-containing protein [Trueperaceae bacterium]
MNRRVRRASSAFSALYAALCAALFVATAVAQDASPTDSAAGAWQGAIEIPGQPLEVTVRLDAGDDGWSGTIDIPAQGANGVPLSDVAVDGVDVSFAIADVQGSPTLTGTVDGDEMTGMFTQAGQEFPFALRRGDDAAPGGQATDDADAPAGVEAQPAPERVYEEPQGRFSFPVPGGWQVTEADGFVTARDPSGGIRMHVVVSEGDDLERAVTDAWSLAVPQFDLEPDETLEPPSDPGVERTLLVNYDPDDDDRVVQALAQLHDGTIYTLLIDADLADLQRRASQLQIVASGLSITAIEDVDLTGEERRPVEETLPELRAFIEEQVEAFGVPGASIAIVQDGEVVHVDGFGTTVAGGGEPVTPETQMMIGSTGKTMTSLLVATLVDAGVVEWDTPVVDVLPQFAVADPELTEEITLRNLLCACTGVPRRDFELFFNADELDAEGIVEQLRTFEFFTDFGEAFQYSNQLVATAGYAAAAADGASYGELFDGYATSLSERVLGPIGLDRTTLSFEDVRARGVHAVPHQQGVDSGAYEPIDLAVEEILLPVAPAGVHWSTARDMGRYMATILSAGVTPDGQRVVSEATLRETWEPQVPISATESYGLGWIVGEYKGLRRMYHSGNTLGFTSEFVFVPEADVGIVVLTNGQGTNAFSDAVATRLLELTYDIPTEAAANAAFQVEQAESSRRERLETLQAAVDPDEVDAFVGTYRNDALGEIVLEMDDGQLVLDAGEFRVEVRPTVDDAGEFDGYVTYGVPLSGLPLELDDSGNDGPVVVFGQGALRYAFERAE